MAAKYIPIGDTQTNYILLAKNANSTATQYTGLIKSIRICNHSDYPATVTVWIRGTESPNLALFIIKNIVIPSAAVLDLDDNISFNINSYDLRLANSGTDPKLTIRIE